MNAYTEIILSQYFKKSELLAEIERDIAEGKLPVVTGNILIEYVLNTSTKTAAEVIKDAERQQFEVVEEELAAVASALGAAFRKLQDTIAQGKQDE